MVTPIEQRYIDLHPKSAEKYAVSKGIFPNGVTHDARNQSPFPHFVTHAAGAYKWDVDGNRIIDYRTGHGSMILGHSHPDVVAAVTEQMSKGTHFSASTDLEIEWGELVKELVPCAEKVRFTSSGTEATMMAFRIVRAYTGKTKIIKFEDHFHGWNDYALAGGAGLGGIPRETLSTMIVLPRNDIGAVEKTIRNNEVAAVILEPTGSHMGTEPILPTFLRELRELTEQSGTILVFDEVVTGFRTSKGGAQGYYGVTPDVSSLAKILGGGLPGGAVAGKADIIDTIQLKHDREHDRSKRVSHPGTFNANPLSASAGVTALKLLSRTTVNEKTDAMGRRLKAGINEVLGRMEVPGCASGLNSLVHLRLGVEHECDKEVCNMSTEELRTSNDAGRNSQLHLALMNRGVDSGYRFIMHSALSEQDVDETVEAVQQSVADLRAEGLV